jgi:hypothetical protein
MASSSIKVRSKPGLSAYQLADFMTSSPSGQITILKNAKYIDSGKPKILQYQIARAAIGQYLISPTRDMTIRSQALATLQQRQNDSALKAFAQDDAKRSIEAIETFQKSLNSLDLQGNVFEMPDKNATPLMIHDVAVSVQPDAIVMGSYKQEDRIGSAFLRLAKGAETEAADANRSAMFPLLAALAHLHTASNLKDVGVAHAPLSLVIDVPRGEVCRATTSLTRKVANIEASCRFIGALWPSI